jgi:hypothetical protein
LSWSGSVTTAAGPVASERYRAVNVLEMCRAALLSSLSVPLTSSRRTAAISPARDGESESEAGGWPALLSHSAFSPARYGEYLLPRLVTTVPHQGDELLTGSGSTGGSGGGVEIGGVW